MESRTKMGQRRSAVQDDFYIFPVGAVYYVKFRDPITRQLLSKKSTGQRNKTAARQWAQEEWDRRTERAGKSDMILYDALERGIIESDPVQRLGIAHTREKRTATGVDNLKTLFDPKNWPNPRIRLAVMTAGLVGLRAGEVRGIKWRDIDKEHDVIRVDREVIEIEGKKLPNR
jgi:integrase